MSQFNSRRRRRPRRPIQQEPVVIANEHIRATEVRVIGKDDSQIGVMNTQKAIALAKEQGMDLILVTAKVTPPVARLGNYGKFLYQKGKKEKSAKRQTSGELKEVRLTFNMSSHDMEIRGHQAGKFLEKGNRVRVTLPLRGRQKALEDYAREKMRAFLLQLKEIAMVRTEREIKREPRGLSTIIVKQ